MNTFETFEQIGMLHTLQGNISFADIPWSEHPTFDGVALKHLVTAAQTDGAFSYHLVKIAPGKKIGLHTHKEQLETNEIISGSGVCRMEGKELSYTPGVISILPQNVPHEVAAEDTGLYLFAKFMPALN